MVHSVRCLCVPKEQYSDVLLVGDVCGILRGIPLAGGRVQGESEAEVQKKIV